jgi:uncharacterized membrane-anchored protein YjiN (DUF445 family)
LSKDDIRPYSQLIEKAKTFINSDAGKKFFETEIVVPYKTQIESEIKAAFKSSQTQLQAEIDATSKKYRELGQSPEEVRLKMEPIIQQKQQQLKQIQQQIIDNKKEELNQTVNEKINTKIAEFMNFSDTPVTQGFQKARYDGYLQGTEVGMVLFYTDILAKIWALNYLDSTPSKIIQNFSPRPRFKFHPSIKKK